MTENTDKTAADPNKVDAIKLSLMLTDLRLPTINQLWQSFAKRADAEGWTAARFLAALVEHELAERDRRRIERHLREARLLPGKTLASFDFNAVPMISKAQINALAAGDAWLTQGANCLIFGPPGAGKSHLASAIGLALVENGYRVFFTRTTDLVQRMQVARRELALESLLARLDRYHLLILDDLAYVQKDQAETSVLFEAHLGALRTAIAADHRKPALRGLEQGVPGRNNRRGRRRPPRPPRHHPRDERRELQAPRRARKQQEKARAAGKLRHREKHQGLNPPRRQLGGPVTPLTARGDRLRGPLRLRRPPAASIPASRDLSRRDNQNQKMLAIADAQGNPHVAAAAGNLILIDVRLSPRLSHTTR